MQNQERPEIRKRNTKVKGNTVIHCSWSAFQPWFLSCFAAVSLPALLGMAHIVLFDTANWTSFLRSFTFLVFLIQIPRPFDRQD